MPKNIVIFSDGTGQEGGVGPDSNVYKLFKAVEDRTTNQIAFYDRGVGTGWRGFVGGATGAGISENIKECYQFIFENFEADDQIYLFGFSRGAATVRSLSGFMHHFGILPKSRPELIKKAYKIYKIKDLTKRTKKAREFREKHNPMWAKIQFLGVWDTVTALGAPNKYLSLLLNQVPFWRNEFHDYELSKSVVNARHALSIDDERLTFHPTLWDEEIDKRTQTMEQVWFCGVHTDVGGGYKDDDLSNISLKWMLDAALSYGLKIYHDPEKKTPNILDVKGDVNGKMHDSRTGLKRFYRKKIRFWPKVDSLNQMRGKPQIHPSVFDRKVAPDNETKGYEPWILDKNL